MNSNWIPKTSSRTWLEILGVGVTHIDEISQKLKEVVDNVQRRRKGTFIIDQTFISLMWIPKSEIGQYEIDISSRRQL